MKEIVEAPGGLWIGPVVRRYKILRNPFVLFEVRGVVEDKCQ